MAETSSEAPKPKRIQCFWPIDPEVAQWASIPFELRETRATICDIFESLMPLSQWEASRQAVALNLNLEQERAPVGMDPGQRLSWRVMNQNRRAIERRLPSDLTVAQWRAICKAFSSLKRWRDDQG
jgi:hypothetical protein